MSTILLVHGAMHGGWCWKDVRRILLAEGHDIYAPTLTGLADRRHLLTRETGLNTHIRDIASLLLYEELTEVVLVGHSYGGMVAEAVAHQMPERIARIVHLHSFVPRDGDCVWTLQSQASRDQFLDLADQTGDGWLLTPQLAFVERWGLHGPNADDLLKKLTPMPLRCLMECVTLRNPAAESIPRLYVQQSGEPMRTALTRFEDLAKENGWETMLLDAQHDSMLTNPNEVATAISKQP